MALNNNTQWHRLKAYFCYMVCALQIILAAGCGSDNADPASSQDFQTDSIDTASVQFSVQWHTAAIDATPARMPTREAIADCSTAGIAFVTCDVYDESNAPIAGGGPWSCEDHGATVQKIPPGPDRTFVVLGWDAAPDEGGIIVYQGITSGIELTAGEVADVGTIDANAFVPPEPAVKEVYGNRIDLAWEAVADPDVAGYRMYRNGEAIADTQSPEYSDTNLTENTEYCYTVSVYDIFDHESAQSDPLCRTTLLTSTYYRDFDEDGYGDPADPIEDTAQPTGYVADNTDCDDHNPDVHPGAAEIFDGIDNDCDGDIDEQYNPYYLDSDGDGYGNPGQSTQATSQPEGYVANDTDCDDTLGSVHPDAEETCNEMDDDCDGDVDEGCIIYYRDFDGDTYGNPADFTEAVSQPAGYVSDNTDCDDTIPSVNPGAEEVCNNRDDNCRNGIDEELSNPTTCGLGACAGNTGIESCVAGIWTDDTCDPLAGATDEVCDDIDNDCDGDVDEDLICVDCYPDLPDPVLELTSISRSEVDTYYFSVNNRADFPTAMFAQDPAYPVCDEVGNRPRTVVSFFDEDNNLLKRDCSISSISVLESLYFREEYNATYPTLTYLSIEDRACDNTYVSNIVRTNPPTVVYPFVFNTDNEGWQMAGLYDAEGLDPVGDLEYRPALHFPYYGSQADGAIGLGAEREGNLYFPASPSGNPFIHWDLNSPDLSEDEQWQYISGLSYRVTGYYMDTLRPVHIQTVLHVRMPDQTLRYFTDGQLLIIPASSEGAWQPHTVAISSLGMPVGTTILRINFRIFFEAGSEYNGFILIDNVLPTYSATGSPEDLAAIEQ